MTPHDLAFLDLKAQSILARVSILKLKSQRSDARRIMSIIIFLLKYDILLKQKIDKDVIISE
jgi:hypothetical protein